MKSKFYIALFFILTLCSQREEVYALQQTQLTGTVKDANGETLVGVSVKLKNSQIATSTDLNGQFALTVPTGQQILVFSYIGFVTQEVAVNNNTKLDVVLLEDFKALDEVVVVGYGTQKKGNVIGSVSQVGAEQIKGRNVAQLS